MTSACATSNGKVVVHDLPLDLTVLCIASVVCGRLNSIVERQYTVGSRQAVQHCGRGRQAVQPYTAAKATDLNAPRAGILPRECWAIEGQLERILFPNHNARPPCFDS